MMSRRATTPLLLVLVLLLSACGGDDPDAVDAVDAADAADVAEEAAEDTADAAATSGECAMPTVVQARLEGTGGMEPLELVDAVAINASGGLATIVAATAPIDRATNFTLEFPTVDEGEVLLQVGVFASSSASNGLPELMAGDVFAADDDRYPSVAAIQGASSTSVIDAGGTVEVVSIDDASVCLRFDTTSGDGPALGGTILAERVD